jgi:hypothetical protein
VFEWGTPGLIAAYVVVGLLLLIFLLATGWSWRFKAGAIVLVSACYLVTYYSYPALLGWPTAEDLPARFNLLAINIDEPEPGGDDDGRITLWAIDLDAPPPAEPRAYRVPYTLSLQRKVSEAGEKVRKGLPQLGERKEEKLAQHATPATTAQGEQKKVGAPGKISDVTQGGQDSVAIEFYDLPAPEFPEK